MVTDDVHQGEEQIINICRENILPPIIPAFEVITIGQKTLIKITLSEGLEKPYRTKQGKYLIRAGSKRQASREELARLFQNSRICHNDDGGFRAPQRSFWIAANCTTTLPQTTISILRSYPKPKFNNSC